MKGNLKAIIETTKASGATAVVLGIRIPSNYGPRYTQAFEGVYRDLSEQLGILWIEFFMDLLDNAWPIIRQALTDYNKK